MKLPSSAQSGQILLVVILAMAVALTVGLSLAARTVTNLKISKQSEESQRAFQAAESGVEAAIKAPIDNPPTGNLGNNATYTTLIHQTGRSPQIILNNGDSVAQDIGLDVWLSDYPRYSSPLPSGTYTIYWGNAGQTNNCAQGLGAATTPAIEIVALHGTSVAPQIKKEVFDPCQRINGTYTRISASGNGDALSIDGKSISYSYKGDIDVADNGLIMKVIPLYNSTPIGMSYKPAAANSNAVFPSQGTLVDSTGKSGDTVRKITYFSPYPQIPLEFFSYAILSQ